ncbi:TPA: hypothetical protein HA234_06630 [Candidatus Woesearchaeota archaeon]|nr:hypothetical protein [Candidatus Woesearchaeota archaeon]
MERTTLIKTAGMVLAVIIILIVGWKTFGNSAPEFDCDRILQESEAKSIPTLEKDYDTSEVQVRHLSWGKLNYYPETITIKAGKKVQLVGDVERLQGCFRSFTIPDLKVNGQFTEDNNIIEFTAPAPGTFGFSCSMGMGSGKLVVE